jgi:hypothetical protein
MPRRHQLLQGARWVEPVDEQRLALTKMNWNNTQFDGGEPITLRAARQVANILRYVGEEERVEPRYGFYI